MNAVRHFTIAAALAVCVLSPAAPANAGSTGAPADDPAAARPQLGWGATYASWYSFQGIDYSDRRPVVQPQASVALGEFSFGAWGNVDQDRGVLNELDLSLLRSFERGRVSGSGGYVYLRYPHRDGWAPSHELVADLEVASPLQPSLSIHWDVAEGRGRYLTVGVGHELALGAGTAGLNAKLHAQDHYYGMSGFPAAETGISLTFARGMLDIQPALTRVWAWENGDFRDEGAIESGWVASLAIATR